MEVRKEDVERVMNCQISDEEFLLAVEQAKHKQKYLFDKEKRANIMEYHYLVMLAAEQVKSNALSRFTLARAYRDMEKEHLFIERGTPPTNHILSASVQ